MFELDKRLDSDTFFLCDLPLSRVLLMNDSQFPWIILVPRVDGAREIIDLSDDQQHQFLKESAMISHVINRLVSPQKLNVAALGNVVSQLHIHHVGRFDTDVAWPKPVWGNQAAVPYEKNTVSELVDAIREAINPA